jgi:hypothetical protein
LAVSLVKNGDKRERVSLQLIDQVNIMNTTERIPLGQPIDYDGLPIKEIALRRPTVGGHLAAQKSGGTDAEREIRLIANLAELPPEAIHQLDMADYMAIQQVLSGFLSRPATATSSKRSSSNSRSTPTGPGPKSSPSSQES